MALPRLTSRAEGPAGPHTKLRERFLSIRREMAVPESFPDEVTHAAREVAERSVTADRADLRHLPFFTLDPAGSMDLDQAMCLERDGSGYRVRYAIADVPVFVPAGGPVDVEARRRVTTLYFPDLRIPLHPPVISEGAASLLPGRVRPALVWDVRLSAAGEVDAVGVDRALVRSTERLAYADTAERLAAGDPRLALLREIGALRVDRERARGGASLPMPEQEVVNGEDGTFRLEYRPLVPAEDWNAQISLMTGMAGAALMLDAGIGILRTMPAPDERAVSRLRLQAGALGVTWPADQPYGEMLRTLDGGDARHLALIHAAAALFRGAGYTAFDGAAPEERTHAAVASPYAHLTAPLRRLADRFALVVCEAIANDREPPGWARAALPELAELMARGDRTAAAVARACVDAVEAAVLEPHVGSVFPAVVVDRNARGEIVVQLLDPAIVAHAHGHAEPGSRVNVTVTHADVAAGTVEISVAGASSR